MFRAIFGLLAALTIAGCTPDTKSASQVEISRASYSHPGPSTITLFTMVSNRSGEGAHSGLMISGSERVIYDPAGSWYHPAAPETGDVHFGITPWMEKFYIDYHARETYHVVMQTITVPTETADAVIRSVRQQGASPKAYCNRYITTALRRVPGFEKLDVTWWPKTTMNQFATIQGVQTKQIFQEDPDYNRVMLEAGIKLVKPGTPIPGQ